MSAPHPRKSPRAVAVLAALVALAVLAAGCTGSPPAPAAAPERADLTEAVDRFIDDSLAPGMRNLRALVITVNGETVVERYDDSGPDETANIASVTKSVVSTLVGIAIDEGHLRLDDTLDRLLPAYVPDMSPDVRSITLQQLLTMTSGLPADGAPGTGRPGRDWVRHTLQQGVVQAPGTGFAYASAGSHLLSAILVEATGRPVLDYAREKLFDPLDIDTRPAAQPDSLEPTAILRYEQAEFAWPRDPQGIHVGFGFIKLTARDMAKLGNLFLEDGRWQGEQIVPADWVREATSPVVRAGDPAVPGEDYGYQWWVTRAGSHGAFAAVGLGGQIIEVVPDLGLVVVASVRIRDVGLLDAGTWVYLVDTVVVPNLEPADR